jgi:hypothetical protein
VRAAKESMSAGNAKSRSAPTADAQGSADPRAIQESDIFKVGSKGSKLLFLLNTYRGLQVVSYKNGADSPRLLARVSATGNNPDDMYYDEAGERLVVLERLWFDQNSGSYNYNRNQSRVLVYDVSNPAEPKISQSIPFEGEIAESRMVGDILYIASSVRPNYWDRRNGNRQEPKGMVHSFKMGKSIQKIQSVNLNLPAAHRENMNIVEVKKNGRYHYYLLAVLSEARWSWWDRQSLVEVVDISDTSGKINPVMVASTKGQVRERSSTTIKNDTLVVVSNSFIQNSPNNRNRWRRTGLITVETFNLPTSKSEVISEDKATLRKLWIQDQIERAPDSEKAALRKKLTTTGQYKLSGVFVETKKGSLRKMTADFEDTRGDSTGLSANLQDVRFVGDFLYAFWVPQNNIDPFELYDFRNPEKGVPHIKRLQFDGWVEHAIPVTYDNRQFVIGRGGEIKVTQNPVNGRNQQMRFPKSILFEVFKGRNGKWRAEDMAELTLSNSNVWANLNRGDKYIDVKFTGAGKGSIMFQISGSDRSSTGRYKSFSGGKLVDFDLAAAASGDVDETFTEGPVLKGPSGWLKRVFRNPEVDRVNTFSDQALATFDVNKALLKNKKPSTALVDAVNVLELARNIRGYSEISKGSGLGVQIVSNNNYWYSYGQNEQKTELRLVKSDLADSELDKVKSKVEIKGNYEKHLYDKKLGVLMIISTSQKEVVQPAKTKRRGGVPYWDRYERTRHLSFIGLDKKALVPTIEVAQELSWKVPQRLVNNRGIDFQGDFDLQRSDAMVIAPWRYYSTANILKLKTGEIFVTEGGKFKKIDHIQPLCVDCKTIFSVMDTVTEACDVQAKNKKSISPMSFMALDGEIVGVYAEKLSDPKRKEIFYARNFLVPVKRSVNAGKVVMTCGKGINIPGTPMYVMGDDHIVTRDVRLLDIVRHEREQWEYLPVPRPMPVPPATSIDDGADIVDTEAGLMSVVETSVNDLSKPRQPNRKLVKRVYWEIKTETSWDSLTLDKIKGLAKLQDLYNPEKAGSLKRLGKDSLVFLENQRRNNYGYNPYYRRPAVQDQKIVTLGFDKSKNFTEEVEFIKMSLPGYANLLSLVEKSNGEVLALISSGRAFQVVSWTKKDPEPRIRELSLLNPLNDLMSNTRTDKIVTPGYSYYGSSQAVNFNEALGTFDLAQGYYGVAQIKVH